MNSTSQASSVINNQDQSSYHNFLSTFDIRHVDFNFPFQSPLIELPRPIIQDINTQKFNEFEKGGWPLQVIQSAGSIQRASQFHQPVQVQKRSAPACSKINTTPLFNTLLSENGSPLSLSSTNLNSIGQNHSQSSPEYSTSSLNGVKRRTYTRKPYPTSDPKKLLQLERNREAAKRCRIAKKTSVETTRARIDYLQLDNAQLYEKFVALREEVTTMQGLLIGNQNCSIAINNGLDIQLIQSINIPNIECPDFSS